MTAIRGHCFLCHGDITDPCRDDKEVICARCVLFMVANPRTKINNKVESFEDWMDRLKL